VASKTFKICEISRNRILKTPTHKKQMDEKEAETKHERKTILPLFCNYFLNAWINMKSITQL
jgi:hypothetical protein